MIAAACSRVLDRALAHDPEFSRLRNAGRSTLACVLTAALNVAWTLQHHEDITLAAPGTLFAMIAPLFLRESRLSGWLVSLFAMAFWACASFAASALIASQPELRYAGLLLVVFIGMLCQPLGPRAVGSALLALVAFYLGLYLHPSHDKLLAMLAVMASAPVVVAFVGRIVLPMAPRDGEWRAFARALYHGASSARARAGDAVRGAGRLCARLRQPRLADVAALARGHRHLAWRTAALATISALLAMLAGSELSEDRSMWAVISTFVVFLGTHSREDTLARVAKRLTGTLAGAAVSALLVIAFPHEAGILMAAMALSVFGWAYFILHAYARGVFFITLLVGLVYGQLGFAIVPLAKLRIEEVVAGCLISVAVAVLLMPSAAARAAKAKVNAEVEVEASLAAE
ncbi:FUSC family protein [Paraburkholderia ferrariae]|uniref:FUSC family protein n=1 Tax=Paraburkholderia ferrariae TaxID=386056 RepID=UPI00069477B5|nr:FUSC family protein [Paraburkholderia ferrariae]